MKKQEINAFISKYMLGIILVILILCISVTNKTFLTTGNILNILRTMSMKGIIAFGMTFVIIAGEIDLSIGSTIGVSGVIVGVVAGELAKNYGMNLETATVVGIFAALIGGILIGLFNGFLLTKFKMPSFIITLGMMKLIFGIAAVMAKGFPVTTLASWYMELGAGNAFGIIPIPSIFFVIVFLFSYILLDYTGFGRTVYAVGGNAEAARLSGLDIKKTRVIIMIIVQVCSVIAGILVSSQVMSGSFSFGQGWEMTVISSVIIGGASLSGGKGKITGTLLGLVFLGVIQNAMTLIGVDNYIQYIVEGALVLVAVLFNTLQSRKVH